MLAEQLKTATWRKTARLILAKSTYISRTHLLLHAAKMGYILLLFIAGIHCTLLALRPESSVLPGPTTYEFGKLCFTSPLAEGRSMKQCLL